MVQVIQETQQIQVLQVDQADPEVQMDLGHQFLPVHPEIQGHQESLLVQQALQVQVGQENRAHQGIHLVQVHQSIQEVLWQRKYNN